MAVDTKVERPVAVEVTEDGTNLVVRPGDATNKALRVNVVAGGGSGGTASNFSAAFPATGTAIGVKASASAPSYTEGDMVALSVDLLGNLRTAGGGAAGSVTINDPTTTTQKLAVDVNGRIGINNFPASVDVSDRSARLLGKLTGSDGSLVQTANAGRLQVDVIGGNGTNASVSTTGTAVPASATYTGWSDGTNMKAPLVFDADTGVGSQWVAGVILRKAASGGSVEAATSSNPLRVDPTGTTTQPVNLTQVGGSAIALGQTTMAASLPVVLASDQSAVSISGTVTANVGTTNGLALDATLTGGTAKAIVRGGAKGTTTAADVTSTASGANHQPLDVILYDANGRTPTIDTFSNLTVTIKQGSSASTVTPPDTSTGSVNGLAVLPAKYNATLPTHTDDAVNYLQVDQKGRLLVLPMKDSGRSQVMLAWEEMTGTAAAESTLTNFTLGSKAAAALTAATTYTVTTGKTLRIQSVLLYVKATSTVNNLARFRIRQAASVANNSPVIFDHVLGLEVTGTIAAGAQHIESVPIPDGLEVAAAQQITFTWFTAANTCTVGMTIIGYEY